MEELRRKFHELNVTLRQIGVDEDKSFIDERILIGARQTLIVGENLYKLG